MKNNLNHFPFSPARLPFFYGWGILIAGSLGIIFSAPGQTIGVSAFTEPLMDALGLSRSALSLTYGIGTAVSGLTLTFVGKLYDRIGGRWSGVLAALGMGLTLGILSRIDTMVHTSIEMLPSLPPATVAIAVMGLAFFFLRILGQGMMTISARNMVMKWFVHRRGLANGLMGVCIGLAFSSSPPLFNHMIEHLTWQGAWRILALACGGFALFALVFYRDNPEACDLVPDGGYAPPADDPVHEPGRDFTLREAAATFSFWMIALELAIFALYVTAFSFHVESLLGRNGFSSEAAYNIFFPAAVIAVFLGLVGGWISDHIKLKYLLMVMLVGMLVSMTGLLVKAGYVSMGLIIAGNGVASAMFGLLLGISCPRFFGRKHLGAISGLQMSVNVLFSAAGPLVFALSLRQLGSYRPIIAAGMVVIALLLGLTPLINRPLPPEIKPA